MRWHRMCVEAGRDDGRSLDEGCGESYTSEQKLLTGMRAERGRLAIALEMMRYSKDLVGKERGTDPDNLTNSEKTRQMQHQAGEFDLGPKGLWDMVGIARSTFYHNLGCRGRPGPDESNPSGRRSSTATNATATAGYGTCCANGALAGVPNGS